MAENPAPSRIATDALARVLCQPRTDVDASHGRLRIVDATRDQVEALLPLLDDVQVEEWTGESGPHVPYRDYIGRLPCGLMLVIGTDAELVPRVELPEGGDTR